MQKAISTMAALAILSVAPAVFAQSIVPSNTTPLTGTVVGAGPGTSGYGSTGVTTTAAPNGPAALAVALATAPNVAPGNPNAVLALIQLDARASGQAIQVSSVPITFAFNGTLPAQYTNCALRDVNNVNVPLNTGAYSISALSPTSALFRFDNPVVIQAGGVVDLALTCAIDPSAQPGQIQIGLNPGTVAAISQSGAPVTPVPGAGPSGSTSAPYGVVTVSPAAGTGTTGGTPTGTGPGVPNTGGTGTPGIPNTGAGGNAPMNEAMLALSGAIALFGAFALARRTVLR